jgi:3-methyladenine DNA glycosylase AlkC
MPEPLKNLLSRTLAADMGDLIAAGTPSFEKERFAALATGGLDDLELMERSALIRDALFAMLPENFPEAAAILKASLPANGKRGLTGWMLLPVNQFIAARGLDDFDLGLDLLKELTPYFTAEFGIRQFIHQDQARALAIISKWVTDPNHHLRRLASEGTRPRLPWAMRLPQLIKDPSPILPILTALMDDPEDYVRRSVANSLNDIAKDHPDMVAAFIAGHIDDASAERRWLLKHASRTLLKKGHAQALANFGFGAAAALECELRLLNSHVAFGEGLDFEIRIRNASADDRLCHSSYEERRFAVAEGLQVQDGDAGRRPDAYGSAPACLAPDYDAALLPWRTPHHDHDQRRGGGIGTVYAVDACLRLSRRFLLTLIAN